MKLSTDVTTGKVGLGTIAAAALIKPFEESLLAGIVGDGNLVSGTVKAVGAVVGAELIGDTSPFLGNAVGIAFGMDAVEDYLGALGIGSKAFMSGGGGANSEEAF
ncbi:hypothetical protein MmiEs2_09060 [Methanimicrococcus stummii]|uniref:Uncharacterized protein n=1 Tax=Methanimicrococcus stummii TaxID=3028294 RepID=A0AA97A862_9EURY|nr:hypothetical protein [Methanimicrococcus sp. Es2]WNY28703.1 hypothetical protein MmiEs2_09060 [Methanimicrococcus sp. Es2]